MGFFEIFAAVLAFFYGLIQSYGLAIILLTITVRIVLLPLSIKQTRSMREMQMIQPEIKKIQTKYKGNRQKMNEEMMALYKEHGVNPLGGCLPLLLQMPVLIGLFYVIRNPLNYLEGGTKLAQDLMEKAALRQPVPRDPARLHRPTGPPGRALRRPSRTRPAATGSCRRIPYLVMVLLMGFTTWYQQKQMQATRGPDQDATAQQMQMFAKIMPFMLMVFAFSFPSGVVLYWLTTNVWTIVQQRIMLTGRSPDRPRDEAEDLRQDRAGQSRRQGVSATGAKNEWRELERFGDIGEGKDGQSEAAKPASKPHPSSKKKKRR